MNVMKIALLGSAALVAATMSARADDLSALKYDMEGINAATALAVADVPASTSVVWSATVKAAITYDEARVGDELKFRANAELIGKGSTETAVGTVGAEVNFYNSWDDHSAAGGPGTLRRAVGWWQITPELKLVAGRKGDNGGVGHGNDKCSCNFVDFTGASGGTGDDSVQFAVAYASGPVSIQLAVEDHGDAANPDDFLGAVDINWSGDMFSAELAGWAGQHAGASVWQVGVGATASLDMFTLSANASINNADVIKASLFASAALSDTITAELGAGIVSQAGADTFGVAGGIYWSPASQLTIGGEASYQETGAASNMKAALVTVFKF
jgi:hypothetical protein